MEIVRDYFIDLYPSCLDRHVLEGWQIAGRNRALECERISTHHGGSSRKQKEN